MTTPHESETIYSNKHWEDRWTNNQIGWHDDTARTSLISLFQENASPKLSGRIFVPLCGASLDIMALAEIENVTEVVGIELSTLAVDKFFEEYFKSKENYKVLKLNECTSLHSGSFLKKGHNQDANKSQQPTVTIKIYQGDLFDSSESGWLNYELENYGGSPFDYIFDRASLIAINWDDRVKYIDLMMTLLGDNAKNMAYFLQGVDYPPGNWPGPPHIFTQESVEKYFQGKFKTIKHLSRDSWGAKFNTDEVFVDHWILGGGIVEKEKR